MSLCVLGLMTIAGSNDRVIQADNFDAIGKIAKSLLVKVCKALPGSEILFFGVTNTGCFMPN